MTIENSFEFVYGIHEGSIHEGGGIDDEVYRDITIALEIAEQLVREYQEDQDDVYGDGEPLTGLPHEWRLIGDGHWTNGIDEVLVVELRVI